LRRSVVLLCPHRYDQRNRLETAVVGSDTTVYSYTPESLTDTVNYPNGTRATYTYYPSNRIDTITHSGAAGLISSYDYDYDSNGNRTRQIEVQNGVTETTDYVYDALDRLERFIVSDGATTTVNSYSFEGYNRKTETVSINGIASVARYLLKDYSGLAPVRVPVPVRAIKLSECMPLSATVR